MKKGMILIVAVLACFFATMVHAALFTENFESDLSQWTGKGGGSHHGAIVEDPLNSNNHVLHFTEKVAGGDIFTVDDFSSPNGNFILSFDYLGRYGQDTGGFIGYSYNLSPNGNEKWLAGTKGDEYNVIDLPDTGQWEHMEISFTAQDNIHLVLEEYWLSDQTVGNAYFDNITLSAVPVPPSVWLLVSGLAGVAGWRRWRFSIKS